MAEEVKLSVQERSTLDEVLLQIRMMELEDEQSPSEFAQRLHERCMQLVQQVSGNPNSELVVIELFIRKLPETIRNYVGSKPLTSLSDALNLVQEWTESEAENVAVHTDTSPGEAVEPQQQQVQIEDPNPSIEESTEETGARRIPETNYRSATTQEPPLVTITTKSDNTQPEINIDDQSLKEQITNCPPDREILTHYHHIIFTILQALTFLLSVGLVTEDKLKRKFHVTDFKLGARSTDGDGDGTEEVKERLRFLLFGGNPDDYWYFNELEKDLLESLNDMDPVKRLETALLHRIFWSESRKLEFIRRFVNLLSGQKLKYSNMKSFQNWKTKVNKIKPGLVEEMEKERAEHNKQEHFPYPKNLYGLVRFIRNCLEHSNNSSGLNQVEFRADVAVEMNFTSIFPDLFETVYKLAKEKDWISKCFPQ
ncbi:uncharacterized protein LOC134303749 [Trichomycterus rosablanca]|uniref:uncharacterized protein LOC134303749 n=1 Tax=Trichomycterus rosablanca TaxID=2290929 RepID=UPI002F35D131